MRCCACWLLFSALFSALLLDGRSGTPCAAGRASVARAAARAIRQSELLYRHETLRVSCRYSHVTHSVRRAAAPRKHIYGLALLGEARRSESSTLSLVVSPLACGAPTLRLVDDKCCRTQCGAPLQHAPHGSHDALNPHLGARANGAGGAGGELSRRRQMFCPCCGLLACST